MAVVGKNENKKTYSTPEMEMLSYSKSWRTKYELSWFVTQMFIEQDAFYKGKSGKLIQQKAPKNYRNITKARTTMRGIKNALTKEEPRRQAKHFTLEDDKISENERRAGMRLLQKVYRDDNVKEKIKDLLHNSLMKSIGFRQVYYDGKKIRINDIDAFDVYLDPHGRLDGPMFTGRWIIKAIPMATTTANKKWPGNKFQSDSTVAESTYKSQIKSNEESEQSDSKYGTIMVYEVYTKEEKEDGTCYIKKVVQIQGKNVETEELDQDYYPILCYQPERFGGKIYPTAWMDPIIELNKSMNRIYSDLEERVHMFSKGRWLKKRNENVTNISDQNGQIIEYDNIPPSYMQSGSPGEAPFSMMSQTGQYIEDAGGTHGESMGRTSGSNVRSASQVSQIQAGDMQNMSEAIDNLRTFLSMAGEIILQVASDSISTPIKINDDKGEMEVVGSKANAEMEKLDTKGKKNNDTIKIKPFKNIKVEIIPGTAFADAQVKQDLLLLRDKGIMIPDEYILDIFKIGDTDEILSKMRIDEEKNKNPDIDIASAENKKMMMGLQVMADLTEDHRIHKAIHAKLLQANKNNTEVAQRIIEHIKQHEAFERPEGVGPQQNPPQ